MVKKIKKCNHENKMYPVFDRFGWVVGYLCDCGYFEFRLDIPNYDQRNIIYNAEKISFPHNIEV